MKTYETEQRKQMISFLRDHPDEMFTADRLVAALCGEQRSNRVSVSTVYRLIGRLTDEGVLHKQAKEGSRKFYYQYVRGVDCMDHLHLKCDCCGRIVHVNNEITGRILSDVLRSSGFAVDESRTLILGTCERCRESV